MKHRLSALIVLVALVLSALDAPAQSPVQRERVEAATLLALGRPASAAEIEAVGGASLADLVAKLGATLQGDRALAAAVTTKAWRDTLGSVPEPRAIAGLPDVAPTYAALVQAHLRRLAADPVAYRAVIERAYRHAMRRAAYDIEFEYWMSRDTLSFVLLVACIENWAVRNQPGLMSTTGAPSISINSAFLTTVRLSPAVAHEARLLLGFDRSGAEAAHAAEVGYHIVAPGAERIVGLGGIHFVATGR